MHGDDPFWVLAERHSALETVLAFSKIFPPHINLTSLAALGAIFLSKREKIQSVTINRRTSHFGLPRIVGFDNKCRLVRDFYMPMLGRDISRLSYFPESLLFIPKFS